MATVFVGDIGTQIKLDTEVDISAATVFEIDYEKPSGAVGTWSGTLSGTQIVTYTTVEDDWDLSGTWKLQAYVEHANYKLKGTIVEVIVKDQLNPAPDST